MNLICPGGLKCWLSEDMLSVNTDGDSQTVHIAFEPNRTGRLEGAGGGKVRRRYEGIGEEEWVKYTANKFDKYNNQYKRKEIIGEPTRVGAISYLPCDARRCKMYLMRIRRSSLLIRGFKY